MTDTSQLTIEGREEAVTAPQTPCSTVQESLFTAPQTIRGQIALENIDRKDPMRQIIGSRHIRNDNRSCLCGCQHVVGLVGTIVEDSDTPKLAEFGLCYVDFPVPCPAGGATRVERVCVDLP